MNKNHFKRVLKERGFSIKDIANTLGMTPYGLSKSIENKSIKVETLEQIAHILEVSPMDLISDGEPLDIAPSKFNVLKQYVSMGLSFNMTMYFYNLICRESDILAHALYALWNKLPDDEKLKHKSEFYGRVYGNEKPDYVDLTMRLEMTVNSIVNDDELKKDYNNAVEIIEKNYEMMLLGDQLTHFLLKNKLSIESDIIEDAYSAFIEIFRISSDKLRVKISNSIKKINSIIK